MNHRRVRTRRSGSRRCPTPPPPLGRLAVGERVLAQVPNEVAASSRLGRRRKNRLAVWPPKTGGSRPHSVAMAVRPDAARRTSAGPARAITSDRHRQRRRPRANAVPATIELPRHCLTPGPAATTFRRSGTNDTARVPARACPRRRVSTECGPSEWFRKWLCATITRSIGEATRSTRGLAPHAAFRPMKRSGDSRLRGRSVSVQQRDPRACAITLAWPNPR